MSLELAEAAADGPLLSATRDERSSASEDSGVVEVCESSETELADGDRRLVFRVCCGRALAATAGDSDLPLPSTLPPPSDLREAMIMILLTTLHFAMPYRLKAEWLFVMRKEGKVLSRLWIRASTYMWRNIPTSWR